VVKTRTKKANLFSPQLTRLTLLIYNSFKDSISSMSRISASEMFLGKLLSLSLKHNKGNKRQPSRESEEWEVEIGHVLSPSAKLRYLSNFSSRPPPLSLLTACGSHNGAEDTNSKIAQLPSQSLARGP
jgi:hypothetical protein